MYCNMAIYCNTLEGNMQYGDDPYCFTPNTHTHMRTHMSVRTHTRMRMHMHTLGVKQYGSSPYCILPSSVLQYVAILQYMTRRC